MAVSASIPAAPVRDLAPLRDFAIGLVVLTVLRLVVGLTPVSPSWVGPISVVISILFIGIPVAMMFRAAQYEWTVRLALGFLITGAIVHAGLTLGFGARVPALLIFAQSGLLVWCMGLGALLATLLKDANVLVPVAIFLALFDIWLVFSPEGPVGQIARGNQGALAALGYALPKPTTGPTAVYAQPMAYVGPADFLFMGMFFVALYKFRLRTQVTALCLAPTLVAYLLVALLAGHVRIGPISLGALPALVPIAIVLLIVNWPEFRMNAEERITTTLLAVIGIALLSWRFSVAGSVIDPPKSGPKPAATSEGPIERGASATAAPGSDTATPAPSR